MQTAKGLITSYGGCSSTGEALVAAEQAEQNEKLLGIIELGEHWIITGFPARLSPTKILGMLTAEEREHLLNTSNP